MRKLILSLVLIVFLAGCVEQQALPTKFKNDILTLEDYIISNSKPFSESLVTIEFTVQNNGDNAVDGVEVNFFDIPGFKVSELDCAGKKLTNQKEWKCVFEGVDRIESLDGKRITLNILAPIVKTETPLIVSYYVKYNYKGYRDASIPIIDDVTRKTPLSKFTESSPSYGPVVMDFEPPVGREIKRDSQVIKEYWGVKGRSFEVKMNIKTNPTSITGVQPINITKGNIRLTLRNLELAKIGDKQLFCDFEVKEGIMVSKKNVEVPKTLVCNLKSMAFTQPEAQGTISAEFSYTYQFTKTESFKVLPLSAE